MNIFWLFWEWIHSVVIAWCLIGESVCEMIPASLLHSAASRQWPSHNFSHEQYKIIWKHLYRLGHFKTDTLKTLRNILKVLHLFIVWVCVCTHMEIREQLWESILFYRLILEIKFRWSRLVVSDFTCCAILLIKINYWLYITSATNPNRPKSQTKKFK